MKGKHSITAFYMEMLVLIVVFVGVILTLTRMFALSKEQSSQARVLTRAVVLAENAAELVGEADGLEEIVERLGDTGEFRVELSWDESEDFVESEIQVYWLDGAEPVYTLRTGAFTGGGEE